MKMYRDFSRFQGTHVMPDQEAPVSGSQESRKEGWDCDKELLSEVRGRSRACGESIPMTWWGGDLMGENLSKECSRGSALAQVFILIGLFLSGIITKAWVPFVFHLNPALELNSQYGCLFFPKPFFFK